jgi:D-glycero-D-manno-heptose 1,7-bisphosphate phosphatase
LIIKASLEHKIDTNNSFMVGDRWTDIEAGFKAGCKTDFIDYHYDERRSQIKPTKIVHSLVEASKWILDGMGAENKI